MSYGTVTIEGAVFRETFTVSETGTTLSLSGQESTPPQDPATVLQLHANVLGLEGRTVPVLFSQKSERNGFYRIETGKSELFEWAGGAVTVADWQLDMTRVGSGADVEFESRVPSFARSSELTGAPVTLWHAAPVNATSYFTGPTVPTRLDRSGLDGVTAAWLSIPANVSPRWTVALDDYMKNACDLYLNDQYAVGMLTPTGVTSWSFDNGHVRVSSSTNGTFSVQFWTGSAWSAVKRIYAVFASALFGAAPELTILRNDPEELTVRLSWPTLPGRRQADLGIRRGSRFVTVSMATHSSTTLGLQLTFAEAGTAQTVGTASQVGGARATAADADGVRVVFGSSRVVAVNAVAFAITKAAQTRFDAFIGAEVGGELFAALHSQYLGTNGERTRVVTR